MKYWFKLEIILVLNAQSCCNKEKAIKLHNKEIKKSNFSSQKKHAPCKRIACKKMTPKGHFENVKATRLSEERKDFKKDKKRRKK